jgi:hypothetical protein
MTADELAIREAMVKDTHLQVRCSVEEKLDWLKRAGGKRKMSEWARKVLNRECLDPARPLDVDVPDIDPLPDGDDEPDEPTGETVVVYDP